MQVKDMKVYSEQDITDILSAVDKMQYNVHVTAEQITAKAHELNVSSKEVIKLNKQERREIIDAYYILTKLMHQQAAYFEDVIREMVPSLRMARDIGPIFSEALKNATQLSPVPVTEITAS